MMVDPVVIVCALATIFAVAAAVTILVKDLRFRRDVERFNARCADEFARNRPTAGEPMTPWGDVVELPHGARRARR